MKTVLAFDFGASSGRAIRGSYDGKNISLDEIHRFENVPVQEDGALCHDVEMMLREIRTACRKCGKTDALAFDTWGVDYGLLNERGKLIALPRHYRGVQTQAALEKAEASLGRHTLYRETGCQVMGINTLFQLLSDCNAAQADTLLFMPDLFGYFLTGEKVCERSIASTSQMLSPVSKTWSAPVLEACGIRTSLLPPLVNSGTVLGSYKGSKVISIAGHDTQCAVAAMPCKEKENAAFLSCGTWSLIGCELDEPVLTQESSRAGLSNELGANGKINYLKNISGLWLIQEVRRDFAAQGRKYTYNDLEQMARSSTPFACFIDPDDPALSRPGGLAGKICAYCEATHQPVPETDGAVLRCIYESLALKYRFALEQIANCTGKSFDVLYMLGGGTKDKFLCSLSADSLNLPVLAGPAEATALGNILLQLYTLGEFQNMQQARQFLAESQSTTPYSPHHSTQWDDAYQKFKKIIHT